MCLASVPCVGVWCKLVSHRISGIMKEMQESTLLGNIINSEACASLASMAMSIDLSTSPDASVSSLFAFAPYKSGSTLLFTGLQLLCEPNLTGMFYKSYYDESFNQYGDTTSWIAKSHLDELFSASGYVYGGFRDADIFTSTGQAPAKVDIVAKSKALVGGCKWIFLLRDPRDCLVSLYYSHLKSHRISTGKSPLASARAKAQSMSIDRYVLENVATIFHNFANMLNLVNLANQASIPAQVFVYENIYYHQRIMFRDICSSLDYDLNDARWQQIVEASHVSKNPLNTYPTSEDASRHIRKGTPGDYRSKLSESTINILNKALMPLLDFLQLANPQYNYLE